MSGLRWHPRRSPECSPTEQTWIALDDADRIAAIVWGGNYGATLPFVASMSGSGHAEWLPDLDAAMTWCAKTHATP